MANHVRRQIRDAALTALTGLATTGAHVYASRVDELQDTNLPALRIITNDEQVDIDSMGASRLVERTLTLVVEACVKENDTFDDTLDQIFKEVETAIAANQGMGGAKYVQLGSIEVEMSGEGEKDVGIGRMTFEVYYITAFNAPDTAQ